MVREQYDFVARVSDRYVRAVECGNGGDAAYWIAWFDGLREAPMVHLARCAAGSFDDPGDTVERHVFRWLAAPRRRARTALGSGVVPLPLALPFDAAVDAWRQVSTLILGPEASS